ncbi:unnamed protein product [Cuscuta europaea]|uniref:Uncharacterized protein n=1 Tax=Cuscuta europaea TaxID=41803 RepID=A0A9P1E991_CUSEU|nr:unnamed protein product [Cuscuta europaea]
MYMKDMKESNPDFHLASASKAGALVWFCTNPLWLGKTRLQLQTPQHHTRPYYGFHDALKTIMKEEEWKALYKEIGPGVGITLEEYQHLRYQMALFRLVNGLRD